MKQTSSTWINWSFQILCLFSISISAAQENQSYIDTPLPEKTIIHTAFLVGDSGGLDKDTPPTNIVLSTIKDQIKDSENASIYFLGDNIYPVGLRNTDDGRSIDAKILDAHIDLAESIDKKSYMIPGNHDWASTSDDYNSMEAMTDYIKSNSSKLKMKPADGCPDPYVIKISKDHVFILIDSQWWVDNADDEYMNYQNCKIKNRHELILELENIFIDHKNDQITVLLHHPLMSNGNHGGKFSLKQHLFPLIDIHPKLYLPLPILGSLRPFYRNLGVKKQDVSYHWNKELKSTFDKLIKTSGVKRILFISGHEHSQQLFSPQPIVSKSKIHYLISGSGYKQSYVRKGGNSAFVSNQRGFQKLYFYEDGSVWLDILSVSDSNQSSLIYRAELFDKNKQVEEKVLPNYPKLQDSINVVPAKTFEVGSIGRFFVGEQYRDVWKAEVKVPVIDLLTVKGGLTPTKLGGGASSNSLRLVDKQGKEYILRSVVKTYNRFLKKQYSDIFWVNYYGDENASALPYGTLTIGPLSDAIELPHSDPKLYYLSHQEALGPYNELLDEGLYMLENRPDGKKWSDQKSFGYAPNIVSNSDMEEATISKASHKVDQRSVLKARLFDMWVHDWDRHADQWRWSKHKEDTMTIYKPIPRDRDWVYYKYEGLIYSFIGKYVERKHSSFKNKITDIEGINMSPAHFDRAHLNELEWSDWNQVAEDMQQQLTDEVIDEALSQMPQEILPIVKEEILTKLTQRRNDLDKYAKDYYEILSKEVSIVGTDNDDLVQVIPISDDSIRVTLTAKRKKKSDIQKYSRTFSSKDTKVVRVYGLQGEDNIVVEHGESDIEVQVIGGLGYDSIHYSDDASIDMTVYDSNNGIKIPKNKYISQKLNDNISNNSYDKEEFKYNSILPTATLGYTYDEGLWLGAGFIKTFHKFRNKPFSSRHALAVEVAPYTAASLMIDYTGTFNNIANTNMQLVTDMFYHSPDYINFFGIFNEENITRSGKYNRVRISSYGIDTKFKKSWNRDAISFSFGPFVNGYKVSKNKRRILENYDLLTKTYDDFEFYVGGTANITLSSVDNKTTPTSGFTYTVDLNYNKGVELDFSAINVLSDLVFYFPIMTNPELVFAGNVGFASQYGESDWFLKPSVGANNHLKSFRNDRLRGERIYYHQLELRSRLFYFRNRYLPMDIGVTAGFEGATAKYSGVSTTLHGFSVGLSMNIGDLLILHPYYARAEKLNAFGFSLGFKY